MWCNCNNVLTILTQTSIQTNLRIGKYSSQSSLELYFIWKFACKKFAFLNTPCVTHTRFLNCSEEVNVLLLVNFFFKLYTHTENRTKDRTLLSNKIEHFRSNKPHTQPYKQPYRSRPAMTVFSSILNGPRVLYYLNLITHCQYL